MIDMLCIYRPDCKLHVHFTPFDTRKPDLIRKRHCLMPHCLTAQIFQFSYRFLVQTAVLYGEFSRQAHLSEPWFVRGISTAGIPVLHPADHDASAVGRKDRLRRIEINSIIDRLILFLRKSIRLFIIISDQAERPVTVMILKPLRQHLRRARDQHPFTIECEEIRALPHLAKTLIVHHQYLVILPPEAVRTAVEEDSAVSLFGTVAYDTAVSAIRFPPYLRVPEIESAPVFRQVLLCEHRITGIFLVLDSVSRCNALDLDIPQSIVRLFLLIHSRIQQQMPSVRQFGRTAGEAPGFVIIHIRRKCRRQMSPMQQIRTDCMSPMHRSPLGSIRIVLIK